MKKIQLFSFSICFYYIEVKVGGLFFLNVTNLKSPIKIFKASTLSVLYCESCRDIRFHGNNFHYNISTKAVDDLNFSQNVLFLTFCYLQKVFISRQRFKALSWTSVPKIPNYIAQTAHYFIENFFETGPDDLRRLQYLRLKAWAQVIIF